MKLSKIAILALKGMGSDIKEKIAEITGVSVQTVYLWIADNKDNSSLTKASVVQLIQSETGLNPDQVLQDIEPVKIAV